MPAPAPAWRRRRRLIAGGVLALIVALGVAAYLVVKSRTGNVSNPKVEFQAQPPAPTPKPVQRSTFTWPVYGYTNARTRYLPASSNLRPPFTQKWQLGGSVLTEFPPVLADETLFILKNNGVLMAVDAPTGKVHWRKKLGDLAASSPAYAGGRLYTTLLQRKGGGGGRVAALDSKTGRILWSRDLPSRTESSPLVDQGTVFFGSEDGTFYALRARDGSTRWTYRASGAVKAGPALVDGRLYFGDYAGRVYSIRESNGSQVWAVGTSGAALGFGSGQFYSTPAVAFGRVYLGNTDGNVYSFATDSGQLAWRTGTGAYVYSSPAVADIKGLGPTVYAGSYDGNFYAFDARTGGVRWRFPAGGRISGAPTIVGDYVYFSNLGARTTVGLSARTGRKVWEANTGAFNPIVSDGKWLYMTGYGSLTGLQPKG